jgi:hypothetical protein
MAALRIAELSFRLSKAHPSVPLISDSTRAATVRPPETGWTGRKSW